MTTDYHDSLANRRKIPIKDRRTMLPIYISYRNDNYTKVAQLIEWLKNNYKILMR